MQIRVGSVVVLVLALAAGLGWPRLTFGQDKGGQEGAFQSNVDLVSVYFTVRDDKKHLTSDLPQDSFSISEDGQPQVIKFFAHHSDVVLNVGVLLDTGTNMIGDANEVPPAPVHPLGAPVQAAPPFAISE